MSKYLYPIYKLKTKSYIRWWLYNYLGKFNNYVLSEILIGTSFYLEDSTDRKFNIFDMIGRTTQESTTGDNLISSENIATTLAGVTYKSQNDGTILANGTKNGGGFANFSNNTVQLEPGEYSATCFLISGTISKSVTVYLYNPNNPINISELGRTGKSFEIAEVGTYYLRFGVWTDGTIFTNAKIGFMLVKGSTIPTEFERYTGGEPAPNPKYPYAIKNTGDNGSVNENVSNSDGTQEQNISFPLAEGQKLMEGDYLADDGVHSLWNEDTVNGTTSTFSDAKTNGAYYCNQKVSGNLTGQTITFDTSVTNAIVQYELAQEQVIPYTQEQKTAWEQIKKARTYKNITHISSEDETPAELKIQYWKEG